METIRNYLITEKKTDPAIVDRILRKLAKHEDILAACRTWVETKEHGTEDALTIEGYTAVDIASLAPFMDGVGVYTFLVSLRENPDKAKEIIAAGFPVR